jgi:hypothetical protein
MKYRIENEQKRRFELITNRYLPTYLPNLGKVEV